MKKILLSVLAVLLLIEELLWNILTVLGSHLSRLLHLQKFECWLEQAPRSTALMVFFLPFLIITPINIIGLALITHGLYIQGLLVEIAAKLLGTVLLARVFRLTKRQMLTFNWFRFLYEKMTTWIRWAHRLITSTAIYRMAKQLKEHITHFFEKAQ